MVGQIYWWALMNLPPLDLELSMEQKFRLSSTKQQLEAIGPDRINDLKDMCLGLMQQNMAQENTLKGLLKVNTELCHD